jgi:hypothetical protein
MSHSVTPDGHRPQAVLPDIGKKLMAKADAQKPDIAWNERIGGAIQRAVAIVGWSNKEAAAKVGVDDAEFGKWLSGGRRPQFDRLLAVPELRWPLLCALADVTGEAEMVTTLRKVS